MESRDGKLQDQEKSHYQTCADSGNQKERGNLIDILKTKSEPFRVAVVAAQFLRCR